MEAKIEVGKTYKYSEIANFIEQNNLETTELGKFLVGENFIVLRHPDKDVIASFMLTGISTTSFWKCVYSDFK